MTPEARIKINVDGVDEVVSKLGLQIVKAVQVITVQYGTGINMEGSRSNDLEDLQVLELAARVVDLCDRRSSTLETFAEPLRYVEPGPPSVGQGTALMVGGTPYIVTGIQCVDGALALTLNRARVVTDPIGD